MHQALWQPLADPAWNAINDRDLHASTKNRQPSHFTAQSCTVDCREENPPASIFISDCVTLSLRPVSPSP